MDYFFSYISEKYLQFRKKAFVKGLTPQKIVHIKKPRTDPKNFEFVAMATGC